MRTLEELTRPNIWCLKPCSSICDEYNGAATSVFLDANESPYNMPHNHYSDLMQRELKHELSRIKRISPEHIFSGNDNDEVIDLVLRVFCEPRIDNVVTIDPTYNMYQVCAEVNDVKHCKVLLDENFQLSADKSLAAADKYTKLILLCSPNNPMGNDLLRNEIEKIILDFSGLVISDKTYSNFSEASSFPSGLDKYPNLIIFQTFSKVQGCIAIRSGMAFISQETISTFNKIKYPYNVDQLTRRQALGMLHRYYEVERWAKIPKEKRGNSEKGFAKLPCTVKTFPSDADFFLARVTDAVRIYNYLINEDIIVRNRSLVSLCGNCLKVTVGTRLENEKLLEALGKI